MTRAETTTEPNLSIGMLRPELRHVPQHSLPTGFRWRWYQPGDERLWVAIHEVADRYNVVTPTVYEQAFGAHRDALPDRQVFIVDNDDHAVATATAWLDDAGMGEGYGRVHWVAVVPARQGQGLARPLLTTVLNRLAELGHTRAYLDTSTLRIPAVNLYLSFGFVPLIQTDDDARAWAGIRDRLKYPLPL